MRELRSTQYNFSKQPFLKLLKTSSAVFIIFFDQQMELFYYVCKFISVNNRYYDICCSLSDLICLVNYLREFCALFLNRQFPIEKKFHNRINCSICYKLAKAIPYLFTICLVCDMFFLTT